MGLFSNLTNTFGVFFASVIIVACIVLSIMWILVPVILYKIKNRLETIISITKKAS